MRGHESEKPSYSIDTIWLPEDGINSRRDYGSIALERLWYRERNKTIRDPVSHITDCSLFQYLMGSKILEERVLREIAYHIGYPRVLTWVSGPH
jgi:hypothetical protein